MADRDRDRDADRRLMRALVGSADDRGAPRHAEFDVAGYRVAWENHTEYAAYTAWPPTTPPPTTPQSGWQRTHALFPNERLAAAEARRLTTTIVEVRLPEDPERIPALVRNGFTSPADHLERARWGRGARRRPHAGRRRLHPLDPLRRCVGRPGSDRADAAAAFHLDTYRRLALLGFGRSHELRARLNELDPDLTALITAMDDPGRPAGEMLHELLAVTAQLEALAMSHRFEETTAYASIVEDRLTALAENRFVGRQTLAELLTRRYVPAIRTAQSAEQRRSRMLERSNRAAELSRIRLDVAHSKQNQALLVSMDRRADLQLLLQTTVEGQSVIAVNYYLLGLLGYLVAPVAEATAVSMTWLLAGLAPLVVLAVWLGLRQVKRRIAH